MLSLVNNSEYIIKIIHKQRVFSFWGGSPECRLVIRCGLGRLEVSVIYIVDNNKMLLHFAFASLTSLNQSGCVKIADYVSLGKRTATEWLCQWPEAWFPACEHHGQTHFISFLGTKTRSLFTGISHTELPGWDSTSVTYHSCSLINVQEETQRGKWIFMILLEIWDFLLWFIYLLCYWLSVFFYMEYWKFYKTITPLVEMGSLCGEASNLKLVRKFYLPIHNHPLYVYIHTLQMHVHKGWR